mmetsp:Transcript_33723/g.44494  ORF Transcript_33723/g.44494 Transcript_33723/m.44494 type:complete len:199 (+) Transcript_33723:35-631(+)
MGSIFSKCFPKDNDAKTLLAEDTDTEVTNPLDSSSGYSPKMISMKCKTSGHTAKHKENEFAGKWEMESQENYGDYLQFVCKLPGFIMKRIANQTYKQTFTFQENIVGITIEGVKNSHTDFEIGAEPLQIDMQGRPFHDTIGWSDDEQALVIERNSDDGEVQIVIVRQIREDGKMVQETFCKATDGTDIVAVQIFRKVE